MSLASTTSINNYYQSESRQELVETLIDGVIAFGNAIRNNKSGSEELIKVMEEVQIGSSKAMEFIAMILYTKFRNQEDFKSSIEIQTDKPYTIYYGFLAARSLWKNYPCLSCLQTSINKTGEKHDLFHLEVLNDVIEKIQSDKIETDIRRYTTFILNIFGSYPIYLGNL